MLDICVCHAYYTAMKYKQKLVGLRPDQIRNIKRIMTMSKSELTASQVIRSALDAFIERMIPTRGKARDGVDPAS